MEIPKYQICQRKIKTISTLKATEQVETIKKTQLLGTLGERASELTQVSFKVKQEVTRQHGQYTKTSYKHHKAFAFLKNFFFLPCQCICCNVTIE